MSGTDKPSAYPPTLHTIPSCPESSHGHYLLLTFDTQSLPTDAVNM